MSKLSHLDGEGRAQMVDVTDKAPTQRTAAASGSLRCASETLSLVREGKAPKGAVVTTAELAGIMAAKRTAELIPLCHSLPLTKVAVTIMEDPDLPGYRIAAEVRTNGVTGVEMEALTAVSVAGLTLFDMLKAVDRTMAIGDIKVTAKSGGKSDWPA
ncbi:cyclic pyranopterin monophosphate synthase MoaC [Sphingomonas astaxanthinifaciens]|uniref:Cyclic pyranopterin monophosphate synthase n=1 Tax=Sphingomonas astaxanthinifaciens DSM 22298 TaxID=1123267 RepID=A0ABQ5ZBW3_9SPHN|nr:cyclic pyranopterin monophosphate synthase MoaC [Sphingomonas astaxanthinifaciens]GLR48363.1 cyclic pyranopterin monophosphate synthase accessory protein [Sphingomonas astaxanthinifaciens DSM 22298]